MNDRKPVLIIYDDGSTEQLLPINITFYERWANAFAKEADRLKQTVMIQPPEVAAEEEPVKKRAPRKPRKRSRGKAAAKQNGQTAEEEPGTVQVPETEG